MNCQTRDSGRRHALSLHVTDGGWPFPCLPCLLTLSSPINATVCWQTALLILNVTLISKLSGPAADAGAPRLARGHGQGCSAACSQLGQQPPPPPPAVGLYFAPDSNTAYSFQFGMKTVLCAPSSLPLTQPPSSRARSGRDHRIPEFRERRLCRPGAPSPPPLRTRPSAESGVLSPSRARRGLETETPPWGEGLRWLGGSVQSAVGFGTRQPRGLSGALQRSLLQR